MFPGAQSHKGEGTMLLRHRNYKYIYRCIIDELFRSKQTDWNSAVKGNKSNTNPATTTKYNFIVLSLLSHTYTEWIRTQQFKSHKINRELSVFS